MFLRVLKGVGKAIVGLGVIGIGLILITVSLMKLSVAVEDFQATKAMVVGHNASARPLDPHVGGRTANAQIVYKFSVGKRNYFHTALVADILGGSASEAELNAKNVLAMAFPIDSEIVVYFDPSDPGDSRLAKAVHRGNYVLLGFGIILVVTMGLALLCDFTLFLAEFFPRLERISRRLDMSMESVALGCSAIAIVALFVSGFFHDPLSDPLGIERGEHLRVTAVIVVLGLTTAGLSFFQRRRRRRKEREEEFHAETQRRGESS